MADVSVRPGRSDDAATLAQIQVEVWQTAYSAFLPPAILALTPDEVRPPWAAAIAEPPSSRHHVLVAQEQEWVVGFAALAPADPQEQTPDVATTALLGPILVQPRWGRRGHGSRLLSASVEHALGDGMTRLICWIAEADEVTRTFLSAAGWQVDGYARALDTGAGELREIRMHTTLTDTGPSEQR
ncbi:acetyltransferase (GNAT) family protein [Jatrophihabitans sp. GAS493]|uniref:GNAT family N-acetyltransferase n=1 Tax=Jatrophihabitans sp. GAS493 TaxID=1907575 RepID=UPI000BB89AE3|nr:GNAT family N-acetyltransferase [Jatrophihabitans sp. GAS493]SOD74148.1 acetyltransferase (GNAT) family protein [Jatrophihabitans sp. GAS493]